MAEYINRGDLALWLNKKSCEYSMNNVAPIGWTLKGLINELATFPSAGVVERKTGKWISYIEDGYLECPFCGAATNCDGDESELHFCFSCGAKMEVPTNV